MVLGGAQNDITADKLHGSRYVARQDDLVELACDAPAIQVEKGIVAGLHAAQIADFELPA